MQSYSEKNFSISFPNEKAWVRTSYYETVVDVKTCKFLVTTFGALLEPLNIFAPLVNLILFRSWQNFHVDLFLYFSNQKRCFEIHFKNGKKILPREADQK